MINYSYYILVTDAPEDICLWVSMAVKGHHDYRNSYKRKHLTRADLQFRGIVHYFYGRKYGGMKADMVLEKMLRVLHLDQQATERNSDTSPGFIN